MEIQFRCKLMRNSRVRVALVISYILIWVLTPILNQNHTISHFIQSLWNIKSCTNLQDAKSGTAVYRKHKHSNNGAQHHVRLQPHPLQTTFVTSLLMTSYFLNKKIVMVLYHRFQFVFQTNVVCLFGGVLGPFGDVTRSMTRRWRH